ncbi:hypothetical protein L915_02624 [Phytophthora nicotianae]|uniref:Uncharacterized protein n=1 Tax=Phytophthora nicotianae TaxID=4792 RepID=W2HG99_PHYNI|nr:hypothetical protein L915_02624 [Phytophthora nicotianae]ETL47668.1 hypothetical protein L916_02601 [Phytophthora nicotianae]
MAGSAQDHALPQGRWDGLTGIESSCHMSKHVLATPLNSRLILLHSLVSSNEHRSQK